MCSLTLYIARGIRIVGLVKNLSIPYSIEIIAMEIQKVAFTLIFFPIWFQIFSFQQSRTQLSNIFLDFRRFQNITVETYNPISAKFYSIIKYTMAERNKKVTSFLCELFILVKQKFDTFFVHFSNLNPVVGIEDLKVFHRGKHLYLVELPISQNVQQKCYTLKTQ